MVNSPENSGRLFIGNNQGELICAQLSIPDPFALWGIHGPMTWAPLSFKRCATPAQRTPICEIPWKNPRCWIQETKSDLYSKYLVCISYIIIKKNLSSYLYLYYHILLVDSSSPFDIFWQSLQRIIACESLPIKDHEK